MFAITVFTIGAVLLTANADESCVDLDLNCRDWIASDRNLCGSTPYIESSCRRSCGVCKYIPKKFDLRLVPNNLQPVAWLVGIWRSEHGGKALFPTIPKFTYGEEIQFSLSDPHMNASKALNYTAFAWSVNDNEELHSENGYLTIRDGSKQAALTTVMNNGFVTVEEGPAGGSRLKLRLVDIGRISFSRDLPVHDMVREWSLINSNTLQSRLDMETLTHGMREHTSITYTKIFP